MSLPVLRPLSLAAPAASCIISLVWRRHTTRRSKSFEKISFENFKTETKSFVKTSELQNLEKKTTMIAFLLLIMVIARPVDHLGFYLLFSLRSTANYYYF